MKENKEIIDSHPSQDLIEATQATHPTLIQQQQPQQEAVVVVEQNNHAFSCYYCSNFQTNVKGDYEHHVIIVHPKKPAYPCKLDLDRLAIEAKGKEWEM